ncbi:P-loop containing nucleoside triphosphate hydrolase protein [Aspergillus karnatakaensis]|uniref:P-loop containing nucleoside triphosphate hydrolase protein n=1 Tax=Aspergillus karnatakaensis TaxID=1810916 RepID=UPI003CCDEE15
MGFSSLLKLMIWLFRNYLRIIGYGAQKGGAFALIAGTVCAMGSGVALPLMNIIFGCLVGDFTQYFIPGSGVTKERFLAAVARNTLFILYLFLLKFVLTYISTLCFRFIGLKASSVLRFKYIWSLLSQLVSKLDEMPQGTVINAINRHMLIATEVFGLIRTVFSLNAEEELTKRYAHWVEEGRKRGLKMLMVGAVYLGLIFFGVYCSFSLAFWYGLRQLYYGRIDNINTIITVFMSVLIAVMVMGQIAAPLLVILKAIGSTGLLFDVINLPECSAGGLKSPQVLVEEDIVLENVTFAYLSRPTVTVLQNFNARFRKGKTTALVGLSGSGKSTVVALLQGWYRLAKNTEGGIYLGGQNINQVDYKWWRSQVALVQQEPFLFNDTIYNNVCMGLIGSRWEGMANLVKWNLVVAACKEAYAHDFIQALPAGYDTVVGERGLTLSGGQRQRLVIARSIVSKLSVLILDEATSSIDVQSERIVQAALERVARNCTIIVIAHRLVTIRKADHIIVMQNGHNVQEGTHADLLTRGGLYKQFLHGQRENGDDQEAQIAKSKNDDRRPAYNLVVVPENYSNFSFIRGVSAVLKSRKRYWWLFIAVMISALGAGAGFSMQSWLFAKLIDSFLYIGGDLLDAADFWAAIFLGLAVSMGACYAVLGYSANSISMAGYVGSWARRAYFTNILRKPVSYFDREDNASGLIASCLSADCRQLQDFCGIPSAFPIVALLSVIGCLFIAFYYGWKLLAVGIVIIAPILALAAFLRVRHELSLESLNTAVYANSSEFIGEAVKEIRTRYTTLLSEQQGAATRRLWISGFIIAFSESIEFLAMALSFWYGGQLLASREYNPINFFVAFIAIIQVAGSAGIFFSFSPNIAQTRAAMHRVMHDGFKNHAPNKAGGSSSIQSHVSMKFSKGLNLDIKGGDFVAFVGLSGCGKLTLISLLERFYRPTSGKIEFGGHDIDQVDASVYRRNVALVSQEPVLFQGTIRENLLLGLAVSEGADHLSMVKEACQQAEIHDVIVSLPDGYATDLGVNAQVSMSGGQKQRLCIARALLRHPAILLLDEATSSLDSESERLIQQSLERLAGRRDLIIIAVAHRLATVQQADCIYVFGDGSGAGSTIVERGSHHELLKLKGRYFQMVFLSKARAYPD